MSAARLREALTAGGPTSGKGDRAAAADGVLSPTPDSPDAAEWRARASIIDTACASSSYLDEDGGECACACVHGRGRTAARGWCAPRSPLLGSARSGGRGPAASLFFFALPLTPPIPHHTASKPDELYGKFTWRIEGFSEVSKRELRSTVFEVGGFKWCVSFSFGGGDCQGAGKYGRGPPCGWVAARHGAALTRSRHGPG
jgi:hypothetical protein